MIRIGPMLVLTSLLSACGGSTGKQTVPMDAATPADRGPTDAGLRDFGPDDLGVVPSCTGQYRAPETGATPGYPELVEASGVAASRGRADLLWLHNDSGDDPVLYAIGVDGRPRGRLRLPGEATDWEDVATAACPDGRGHCVWVGDIGDNTLSRRQVNVLAVREPDTDGDQAPSRVWRFPLRYPDVPHDSEALIVAPSGDKFWVFEKTTESTVRMFGHPGPLVEDQVAVLQETTRFSAPGVPIDRGQMVTAADLHPDGARILIRVYTGTYEYMLPTPLEMSALNSVEPKVVAFGPLSEQQGEAVAYDESGRGVWTIAEDPSGEAVQPLHHYDCDE